MDKVFEQMVSKYQILTDADKLNAYHEVMQVITLSALQRAGFFNKAAFYGGTCLRVFYELPRFSEDMDFSLLEVNKGFSLQDYFPDIVGGFKSVGREVVITKKEKKNDTKVESAFLKDQTEIYNIQFQTEKTVKIKIEVDTYPPLGFETESKLLLEPFSFMTRCFTLPDLYAGKMHALLFRDWKNRVKGRDWYDFEWYVRKGIKLNFNHLKLRALQKGFAGEEEDFTVDTFKTLLKEKIQNTSIDQVKRDVFPFIKDHAGLDIWSIDYFVQLVDMVQFE